ncbi:MAG TPA: hypothetical protein VGE55_14620 [Limnobacter sp.]|uniref:hypothetical protein n=1 Tax=Limnobacter sp. TaxID=2003368 RepID=UPI002ED988B8
MLNLRSPGERVWLADCLQVWCLSASHADPQTLPLPWSASQDGVVFWLADDSVSPKATLRRLNRCRTIQGDAVWAPWYVPDYLALCLQTGDAAGWWVGLQAISMRRQQVWETLRCPVNSQPAMNNLHPIVPGCSDPSHTEAGGDSLHALSARLHAQALCTAMAAAGVQTPSGTDPLHVQWLCLAKAHPMASAHDIAASLLSHAYLQTLSGSARPLGLWSPGELYQALTESPGQLGPPDQARGLLEGLMTVHLQFADMGFARNALGTGGGAVNWAEWLLSASALGSKPGHPVVRSLMGSGAVPSVDAHPLPKMPADCAAVLRQAASTRYLPHHPLLGEWPVCTASDASAQYPLQTLQVIDDRALYFQVDWARGAPVLRSGPQEQVECCPMQCTVDEPLKPAEWLGPWLVQTPGQAHNHALWAMLQVHADIQGQWTHSPAPLEMNWQWFVESQWNAGPGQPVELPPLVTIQGLVGSQLLELSLRVQPALAQQESGSTSCATQQLLPGQPFWSYACTWPLNVTLESVRKPGWPEWQLFERQAGALRLCLQLWRHVMGQVQASASLHYQPPTAEVMGWCPWTGVSSRRLQLGSEQTLQHWETVHG